jgi:uncharacterized protein Yka (UPF0111/DUF47 family)
MPAKSGILEDLGETALLLPQLINRALAANDRIKYFLTLFQSARNHAEHPDTEALSLRGEREASGVDDASLDAVVSASRRDNGNLHVPQAAKLHTQLIDAVREMLEPLKTVAPGDAARVHAYEEYRQRFDRLAASAPSLENDRISLEYIDAITEGRRSDDGIHALVMDLHRELNGLQRDIAIESLDGASVYGIAESDRPLVSAFMAGVNATAPLKFDHPGLSTTATRTNGRLVLQNDLGTTDNHVFVLHIEGLNLSVMYTDVHPVRLRFFQTMLEPVGFKWTASPSGDVTSGYQLSIGQVVSRDREELRRHLTLVGSRLVFVIDWNRARKRLSRFVKKPDAIAVLKWAADQDLGHRAFLQAGDVQLVYTALERAGHAQIRLGARLDEILGRESARTFLQAVLRIASEGLRDQKSPRLIQDQIHAELLTHLQSSEQSAFALAIDHALMVAALAGLVRDTLARSHTEPDRSAISKLAARAKAWESRADEIVSRARTMLKRTTRDSTLIQLLGGADDVADGLEEAAFLLTLLADGPGGHKGLEALRDLADLVVAGAQGYIRCLECARDAHHFGTAEEVQEFLVAVDGVIAFEHQSDEQERKAKAVLIEVAQDFRQLHVLSELSGCFENAADTLARCALILRDYVLETLNAR